MKQDKKHARHVVEDGKVTAAVEAFKTWCGDGMKVNEENHPMLCRICAVAIAKVLMPKVAPLMKVGGFTTCKIAQSGWES